MQKNQCFVCPLSIFLHRGENLRSFLYLKLLLPTGLVSCQAIQNGAEEGDILQIIETYISSTTLLFAFRPPLVSPTNVFHPSPPNLTRVLLESRDLFVFLFQTSIKFCNQLNHIVGSRRNSIRPLNIINTRSQRTNTIYQNPNTLRTST